MYVYLWYEAKLWVDFMLGDMLILWFFLLKNIMLETTVLVYCSNMYSITNVTYVFIFPHVLSTFTRIVLFAYTPISRINAQQQ